MTGSGGEVKMVVCDVCENKGENYLLFNFEIRELFIKEKTFVHYLNMLAELFKFKCE